MKNINNAIVNPDVATHSRCKYQNKKDSYVILNSNYTSIVLYNMDCIKGMKKHLPKKSIDVVVTSPPYNLGTSYNQYNDNIPRDKYIKWLEKVSLLIKEKLKDDGSFFLNIGSKPIDPWVPFEVAIMLKDHFYLQNVIHWIKSIYIENGSYNKTIQINVGHYKPIHSNRFLNDIHEFIFHFTIGNNTKIDRLAIGVPYKDEGNISRWKSGKNAKRCRGNSWYVPYKTINSREKERPHPASFPYEIAELCIKLHGINNSMHVLDPFMGIGNTSIACHKLKINCIGFEIDKTYFNTNINLIEKYPF